MKSAQSLSDLIKVRYEVEVIKDGFLFEGIVYKSLSVIARQITGAQCIAKNIAKILPIKLQKPAKNSKKDRLGALDYTVLK